MIEHEDFLCIAFRRTDERSDWKDNTEPSFVSNEFGKFHKGFWDSVEDIWKPLNEFLKLRKLEMERPLFITGHSLGEAMATN